MEYLKNTEFRYKLYLLLIFFFPGIASASEDLFTPVSADYFQNFLNQYVEYLYPAIFLINTVIMLYAASQFVYNWLMGMIHTANEGVIMGKGWNTSNIILRTLFVTLFLIPYAQYNNTQVIVLWVAKMGSGLADKVITLEKVDQSVDPLKVYPSTIKAQELARALLESQVCMLTYNHNLDIRNSKTKFEIAKDQNKMSAINYKSKDGKFIIYDFGLNTKETTDGSWFRDINPNDNGNVCGQIQLTIKDTSKAGTMDTLINAVAISNAIYNAKTAAFNTMFSSANSFASKYVNQNYNKEILAADIDSLANAYVQSVSQAATSALSDNTNTATESSIDDLGWVMTATKSTRDIMKHFIVDQEVTAFPFAKGVIDLRNLTNLQKENFKGIDSFRTTEKQAIHLLSGRTDPVLYADSEANSDISPESAVDKFQSAYSFNPRPEYTNEINPYTYSFQYGMNMMNNSMNSFITILPIFVLAKLGGLDFVLGFPIVSILIMYTVMGATLAYVIPMLPMITFAVGVIGYFITILQALFAAPLWVLGHAKPKADDFVGDKGHGYLLLATLILKPALMTIGVLYITPLALKFGYALTNMLFNYTVYLPDGVSSCPSVVF
uniref:DotA/TraY family protein n=1 Tax=Acinetobacter courvalinii TaxID=280147 RepID=UPI00289F36AA